MQDDITKEQEQRYEELQLIALDFARKGQTAKGRFVVAAAAMSAIRQSSSAATWRPG